MLPTKFQNHWLSLSTNLYRQIQFQTSGKYQKLHHFINQIQNQTSAITVQYLFDHVFLKYQSKSTTVNFQIILKSNQFGFRPRRSTELAYNLLVNYIRKNIDNGLLTGVIYLDLSKAFDTVSHSYLLSKLPSYGISGNEFTWFENNLLNQEQHVFYDGHLSKAFPVFRGVPQGSILGPILFLLQLETLITVYTIPVLSSMLTIQ